MINHYQHNRTYSPQVQRSERNREHIAPFPDQHKRKFFELQYLCHEPSIARHKEAAKRKRRDQLASYHSRTLEITTINLCPNAETEIANPASLKHPQKIHSRAIQTNDPPCTVAAKRSAMRSSKCERRMRPNSSLSDHGIIDFASKQGMKSRLKAQFQQGQQCIKLMMQDETAAMTINPVCYSDRPATSRRQVKPISKEQPRKNKEGQVHLKASRIKYLRKQAKPVRPWSPVHQNRSSFQFEMVTLT